ncbi:hypothetical protein POTOM_040977 [Populus tomentosa]|uniref:Uncharacterized protein n=1 Tax=Populus tomentosa TaxID=118781 RepID=A0A8X7YR35_POPTO|nr:hypothetical protein POTOM_040977 [Populus tomentosa]
MMRAWIVINTGTFNTRQKRKLDEMYDQLRSEYESNKRSAIQPANNFFSRNEPDLFSNPAATMMDNRDPIRKVLVTLTTMENVCLSLSRYSLIMHFG